MAVIDLSGGLAASVDYGVRDLRAIGEDGMRDAVSVWIYDDKGRFGFPRLALEASGPDWDSNLVQVSVAFPDGRILDASGPRPARQSEDENGNPSIFAADGI
jgi:hypothetical protein